MKLKNNQERSIYLKKLTFLSMNRGIKENEIIFKKFLDLYITDLDIDDMILYHHFLLENDLDIFNWIIKKGFLPKKYQNSFINKIIALYE